MSTNKISGVALLQVYLACVMDHKSRASLPTCAKNVRKYQLNPRIFYQLMISNLKSFHQFPQILSTLRTKNIYSAYTLANDLAYFFQYMYTCVCVSLLPHFENSVFCCIQFNGNREYSFLRNCASCSCSFDAKRIARITSVTQ